MSNGQYVVLFSERGGSQEFFSQPMTYDGAKWAAGYFERQGRTVIAVVTTEHAEERKRAAQPGPEIEGAHLRELLDDIVQRFDGDYPGVSRETALRAISFLCGLVLNGERDLQAALLNEIHTQAPLGLADWRTDMQFSIRNRRPEGGS